MKHAILFVMLVVSIAGQTFAQNGSTNTEKTFEPGPGFAHRKFMIDIGKGNKIQIELTEVEDLGYILNIDSLIEVFVADIKPFKDSLEDELTSKKIDYRIDSSNNKKIRIQQFAPAGFSYTIKDGEPAALKLEQDTVNFTGTVNFVAKYTLRKAFNDVRYYRLSFFINDVNDIGNLIGTGLNEKMKTLREGYSTRWDYTSPNHVKLRRDPTITANHPQGFAAGDDFLEFRVSVNAQNYKSYFVPSVSLSAGIVISSHGFYKREFDLTWEPHFFFSKDDKGSLKTFRNDFLSLTWAQGPIKDNDAHKESPFTSIVSFGYLVHRSGDFFTKNTMRFGAGRLSLFEGKTKIEPVIYFNNFFKGVTPGLRWIQSF
jgi:hypothetical protein